MEEPKWYISGKTGVSPDDCAIALILGAFRAALFMTSERHLEFDSFRRIQINSVALFVSQRQTTDNSHNNNNNNNIMKQTILQFH